MRAFLLCTLILPSLAACGADGPPVPPQPRAETPGGITVSGDARIGVVGTF